MSICASVEVDVPPEELWPLVAQPGRWHEWAWHLRGATGLGSVEVLPHRTGVVWVAGLVPVPVTVSEVDRPRRWAWRAGPIRVDHEVQAHDGGSRVAFTLRAPGPVEALLRPVYGPVMRSAARRLGTTAEVAAGRR